MRSAQVHKAITQGNTRFEICQLVSKGVRITHKGGTRMEDSIGTVLGSLGSYPAASRRPPLSASEALAALKLH